MVQAPRGTVQQVATRIPYAGEVGGDARHVWSRRSEGLDRRRLLVHVDTASGKSATGRVAQHPTSSAEGRELLLTGSAAERCLMAESVSSNGYAEADDRGGGILRSPQLDGSPSWIARGASLGVDVPSNLVLRAIYVDDFVDRELTEQSRATGPSQAKLYRRWLATGERAVRQVRRTRTPMPAIGSPLILKAVGLNPNLDLCLRVQAFDEQLPKNEVIVSTFVSALN